MLFHIRNLNTVEVITENNATDSIPSESRYIFTYLPTRRTYMCVYTLYIAHLLCIILSCGTMSFAVYILAVSGYVYIYIYMHISYVYSVLHIRGISNKANPKELIDIFAKYGEIESSRIPSPLR